MIDKILQAADKLSELYGNEEWVASEREPTIKILQELVEGVQNQTNNNGSTPCRFFSGDGHYQSVPWCNHAPSQRAMP